MKPPTYTLSGINYMAGAPTSDAVTAADIWNFKDLVKTQRILDAPTLPDDEDWDAIEKGDW